MGIIPEAGETLHQDDPPGIVIRDGGRPGYRPVITAFIWGAKLEPVRTLPFGRWKPATA